MDEMVVLDTSSTEQTVEIARKFGAKVYHFEWCDDFSAARYEALKYLQGKWVLVLDADEVLTAEIVSQDLRKSTFEPPSVVAQSLAPLPYFASMRKS